MAWSLGLRVCGLGWESLIWLFTGHSGYSKILVEGSGQGAHGLSLDAHR